MAAEAAEVGPPRPGAALVAVEAQQPALAAAGALLPALVAAEAQQPALVAAGAAV